ncbi:copper resistance protein CopC [Alphaproteobacteria bacterium]|nr:copper resistance protein CopC [Alphaproteobacteria bacterium]
MYRLLVTFFVLVMAAMPGIAIAHSPLSSTNPVDGAVLSAAPNGISLVFAKPATVIKLSVENDAAGSDLIDLSKALDRVQGVEHSAPIPQLPAGQFTVKWRAMSGDGHLIKGDFSFVVTD